MDVYAYGNIGVLDEIVKKNNIEVPRLRGYRLMKDETQISMSDVFSTEEEAELADDLIRAKPIFRLDPFIFEFSERTSKLCQYYLVKDEEGNNVGIRWDRIHGWKRRKLKFAIKQQRRRYEKQYNTFNKYVGREDVLYIHARIGGGNWPAYHSEVDTQPWFIEKVDDAFDSTYCDIYVKIDPRSVHNEK